MNEDQRASTARPVALVCGEPRLRRLLRLALEAGGYLVLDGAEEATWLAETNAIAAVVDLDSLRRCARTTARLGPWGAPDRLPALFISVYPAAPVDDRRAGPTDYLQPPFPPDELVRRLSRLLSGAERTSTACAANDLVSRE